MKTDNTKRGASVGMFYLAVMLCVGIMYYFLFNADKVLAWVTDYDSLQHNYNGATIDLPEEIDCAGTGDTLIVTRRELHNQLIISIAYK